MQDDLEYLEYKIEYIEYFSLDRQTGLVVSSMLPMCQLHIKISPVDFHRRTEGCQPLQSTSVEGHVFQDVSKSRTCSLKALPSWLELLY